MKKKRERRAPVTVSSLPLPLLVDKSELKEPLSD
jgi:hypothetical protein